MSLVIEITETSPVVTEPVVTVIEVAGAGPQGAKGDTGDQGPVGPGVPAGGVEFDLLEKASGDDFDTRFTDTPTVRGLQLSTTNPADVETGRIVWNDGDEVPQFRSNGITVDLSLEMLARCRNVTGTLIPKGTAVCIVGASAQRISIAPSNRTQPGSACRTLGLTLEPIANNGFGKVSTFGLVRGLNTAGIDGDEGDELFVGETPGSLTTTPPDAPARRLTVGYLVTKSTTQGRVFVSIRRGVRVDEIDDVQVDSVVDGDVIRFDDAAGRWENKPLGTAADADVGDFDAAGSADAVQSNLETHIDDATNPHQVTAEQVGLGDVDNVSAADLRDRATHTGEQAISTITGLQAELDDKVTNTDLSNHIEDDTNPHQVTATQVGLGNVDNTADLDKPISNDTQAALDDKADKTTQVIAGTGLDGGGDLSDDRTLNLDSATVESLGLADSALQSGDNVSELSNDAGYIDASGAPVQSVNGETGDVSLDAGDVGLGNVPNLDTTDAVNKAHDQNTDTALAAGTADEVTAADARELLDGTGPQLFTNQANHLQSLIAPVLLPGFGDLVDGQAPALLYGPPSAPLSGQVPQQIGDFRWCYNFDGTEAGNRPSFGLFGSGRHGDTEPRVIFLVDEDNWYQIKVERGRIIVFESVNGVVTEIENVNHVNPNADGYVNFFIWFARDRFQIVRYDVAIYAGLPVMSFLLDDINFIGFETGGGRGRFHHTVVYGQNLNSITSITP